MPAPAAPITALESVGRTTEVVLTIGNFDGVHRGHQRLIRRAREVAADRWRVVAVTFDPHPLAVLAPERAPAVLTTSPQRAALLRRCGADEVVALPATRDLLGLPAEAFLERLTSACAVRAIVEGPTFRFGRGRQGDLDTLAAFAGRRGIELVVCAELHSGAEGDAPAINSTAVRAALATARVADAERMLGRPYALRGTVGRGDARGAELGFATANLDGFATMVPGHQVYACVARTARGVCLPAAVNVGPQPTFDQSTPRVEAHLLDFDGDLRGEPLDLAFIAALRGQVRFASVDALVAQLRADVAATRATTGGRLCADSLAGMPTC